LQLFHRVPIINADTLVKAAGPTYVERPLCFTAELFLPAPHPKYIVGWVVGVLSLAWKKNWHIHFTHLTLPLERVKNSKIWPLRRSGFVSKQHILNLKHALGAPMIQLNSTQLSFI